MKHRLNLLEEKKRLYNATTNDEQIVQQQIHNFNIIWEHCHQTNPFYKYWKSKYRLPNQISRIKDLMDFPILNKRIIQEDRDLIFQNGRIKQYISTGGSTGEPARFPSSPKDAIYVYADLYVGRSWWGIQPFDGLLLFWGHSHLFGTGLKGVLNGYKRKIFDSFLHIKRLNAYDMTHETIQKYYNVYLQHNPSYILGYTSCIYKLAKYIYENNLGQGKKDKLKAVILTSETITPFDVELIQKVFGVPAVIEYGMAETGVIGYSHNTTWDIEILWDSFIAMAPDNQLIISTTYDRLFPLINYQTEDTIKVGKEVEGSILKIASVTGRKQDILRVGTLNGSCLELSGILLIHILKSYPHIHSIQFEPLEPNRVRLLLVADCALDLPQVKKYFLQEIKKDHPAIDPNFIDFIQVNTVSKTIAGKERVVLSNQP